MRHRISRHVIALVSGWFLLVTSSAVNATCIYYAPGNLKPGSGTGVADELNYGSGMAYPFGPGRAVAKSQVYGPGGTGYPGNPDECHASNFNEPHRDTFCEKRTKLRTSLNCPLRKIHQGIDINGGTRAICLQLKEARRRINEGADPEIGNIVPVYAVADGIVEYGSGGKADYILIQRVNKYTKVYYLHLNMRALPEYVKDGKIVNKGKIIGYMFDNDGGGGQTTFHLHFEIMINMNQRGFLNVSPYMAFMRALETVSGTTCKRL